MHKMKAPEISFNPCFLFFFLASLLAPSLYAQPEYEKADAFARSFEQPYTDAADLGRQLAAPFATEGEKARAIFAWIAHNIRYDYKKYENPPNPSFSGRSREEMEKNRQDWLDQEMRQTLRKKRGVCADYSYLFQKMCAAAGLEAVIVTGTARRLRGRGGPHAWNALRVDGRWHLLDATWGAGYEDDEHFVRRYSPGFFLTPPALFRQDHWPDDPQWQLLDRPLSKKEFNDQPMVNYGSPDFALQGFAPENGRLRKNGRVAELRLRLGKIPPVFVVLAGAKRELPARVTTAADGWTVLSFEPGSASRITVFAGQSRQKTVWLGQFEVE
jgi:hypothetical protein